MVFKRFKSQIRSSIRGKLLLLVLFPILLVMPIALALAGVWGTKFTYDQLFIKVNTDLSVATNVFQRIRQDQLSILENLANDYRFREALELGDPQLVNLLIEEVNQQNNYDFLHLTDLGGSWFAGEHQGRSRSSNLWADALTGKPSVGVEIYSQKDLQQESISLANQMRMPLVDTPRARETNQTEENRAMVIRAVMPIMNDRGEVGALLDSGLLLNGNFGFVDELRDLVYDKGNLAEGSIGTVTVFLDDVRISTNVPLRPGERALGTRVSDEVRTKVLDLGETWIDRAFVVNDWYISSYEPIVDFSGERVGILYAGFLEKPYSQTLWKALGVLILLFIGLMVFSAWLAVKGAESIFKPLEAMSAVVRATQSGEKRQRIGQIDSQDEIGELAREFGAMLELLQERQQQLQEGADRLEIKVDERTAELRGKNQDLERTISALRRMRKQLVGAEKLAALGELTAGVAHEINNPAQVILGNMDLLSNILGDHVGEVKEEVDLVVEQVFRIQEIINHLLQYASPDSYDQRLENVDVNKVVKHTLNLTNHLLHDHHVQIDLKLEADDLININPLELEQVLVNLTTNAIHALPESGGEICYRTRNWDTKGVVIEVKDNGCGIPESQLEHIFNPFFTNKKEGSGTGLGLTISYGLMRRYGGNITVKSEDGKGTIFSIWLLSEPKIIDDERMIVEQLQSIEKGEGSTG